MVINLMSHAKLTWHVFCINMFVFPNFRIFAYTFGKSFVFLFCLVGHCWNIYILCVYSILGLAFYGLFASLGKSEFRASVVNIGFSVIYWGFFLLVF